MQPGIAGLPCRQWTMQALAVHERAHIAAYNTTSLT